MLHFCKKLTDVKQDKDTKQPIKIYPSLSVLIIFVIVLPPLTTITAAPAEDSSGSSEETSRTSAENDFVYHLLHAAMDNLTIRANKIHPTSTPIIMDPMALLPPITLVYNTTYFTSPLGNATNLGTVEDDDFDYGALGEWKTKDTVEGYEISSDSGLQFKTKLLKDKKLIQIRVDIGTAWTFEKEIHRRNLDLKIMTWERTNRVRVKVPYGVLPQELRVVEEKDYVDVFAPYGFLKIQGQENQKKV